VRPPGPLIAGNGSPGSTPSSRISAGSPGNEPGSAPASTPAPAGSARWSAPRPAPLTCTPPAGVAVRAADDAAGSAGRADQEETRARKLRTAWAAELSTHQATCAHLGLPAESEALEGAVAAARRAQDANAQLGRDLARLAERARRHAEQLRRAEEAAAVRDATEQAAEESWSAWHAAASELAAQHAAVDLPLEQARAELTQTQAAKKSTERDLYTAQHAAAGMGERLGKAASDHEQAERTSVSRPPGWVAAAQRLNQGLARPGLAAAASAEPLSGVVYPERPDDVRPPPRRCWPGFKHRASRSR